MPKKSKKAPKPKTIRQDVKQGLSKPAIMRILYRAGVKNVSSLVYYEMRTISMKFLRGVVDRSILYSNNRKKSTIAEKDVINSLKTYGFTYLSAGGSGYTGPHIHIDFSKKGKKNKSKSNTPKKEKKSNTSSKKGTKGSRKTSKTEGGISKPHRFKSGTVALRSIRRYQRSTELLIRKAPVVAIVRFLLDNINIDTKYLKIVGKEFRLGKTAREAFHTALEYYLGNIAGKALILALNAKRIRVKVSDIQIAAQLGQMR